MPAGLGPLLNTGEGASCLLPRRPKSGNRRGRSLARSQATPHYPKQPIEIIAATARFTAAPIFMKPLSAVLIYLEAVHIAR